MDFEQANEIIGRRKRYIGRIPTLVDIPTDEEVKEAEKAFRPKRKVLCHSCDRYYKCFMVDKRMFNCNFYVKECYIKE